MEFRFGFGAVDNLEDSNQLYRNAGSKIAAAFKRPFQKGNEVGNRFMNYDRNLSQYDAKPDDGVLDKAKAAARKSQRMYETLQILKQVKDITSFGIRYGNVRDLMFNGGVLDLFSSGQIHNSVQVAIPIIEFFVKNKIIKKFDQDLGDDIQTTPLASLAWNFFHFVNIRGFDWKQMFSDLPSQQAFAQIFLEYISFKIIPQWNRVEDALGNYITSRDEKSKHVLNDSINRLLILFRPPLLFGFMKKYLRFPNMELRLIDYSNATAEQRKKLD